MSLRLEFFDNLLIRATQRTALNDPFEVLPEREWLETAYEYEYQKKPPEEYEQLILALTKYNLNDWGIISLTCRPDNILMWSHYADQHRGIVIELDEKNLELQSKFNESQGAPFSVPVIYRQSRLSKFEADQVFQPYQYKSIDWAYEEEQRVLVTNMFTCDNWFYLCSTDEHAQLALQTRKIANIELSQCELLNGRILKFSTADIINPEKHFYLTDKNVMSMFKLPPKAVKTIILGMLVSEENFSNVKKKITESHELSHIKIKKACLDESGFKIIIREIN